MFEATLLMSMVEGLEQSSNPFLYLVGILLLAISFIGIKFYSDLKADKQASKEDSAAQMEKMEKLEEQNRKESREREQQLVLQLRESGKSLNDITSTIEKISVSQEKMAVAQQEIVEAVQHLNGDFRELSSNLKDFEYRLQIVERKRDQKGE